MSQYDAKSGTERKHIRKILTAAHPDTVDELDDEHRDKGFQQISEKRNRPRFRPEGTERVRRADIAASRRTYIHSIHFTDKISRGKTAKCVSNDQDLKSG